MLLKEKTQVESIWLSPYILSTCVNRNVNALVLIKIAHKDYLTLDSVSVTMNYKQESNTFLLSRDKKVITCQLEIPSSWFFNVEIQIKDNQVRRYCRLQISRYSFMLNYL